MSTRGALLVGALLVGGCSSTSTSEPADTEASTSPAAAADAAPTTTEPDLTTEPAEETTEDLETTEPEPSTAPETEPEPSAPEPAAAPADRAAELRAQFRETHPDLTTDLPEGGSCDDEVELVEGTALAGCATSTVGLVMFLVPADPAGVDAAWQLASSELLLNACTGEDYVAGAFTFEGANVLAETFPDCTFP